MISRRDALKWGAVGVTSCFPWATQHTGAGALQSPSSDWPVHRGDPLGTGTMPGPGPGLDQPIAVKWRFDIEKYGHSSPVVNNNVVYIAGGGETLHAVDADTGQEIWQRNTSGLVWSIAVANDVVYVSDDHTTAISAQTNEVLWTFEHGGHSAITVVDESVFIDGRDRNVYAIDATTGTELWSFSVTGWIDAWERYPVIVSDRTVFVGQRDFVYALDRETGQERWRFSDNEYGMGVPAVSDGVAFVGGDRSILYALNADTGQELWQYHAPYYIQSSPAIANGVVYLNTSNLQALNASTGDPISAFSQENSSGNGRAPIVVDGVVYTPGSGLHAVDAATGEKQWEYFLDAGSVESPAIVNGAIFVAVKQSDSDVDYLYALGNADAFRATLVMDTVIRGAPSSGGAERAKVPAGTIIENMGDMVEQSGETWIDVTINGMPGWIPLEAIDSGALETEYVYIPESNNPSGTPSSGTSNPLVAVSIYDAESIRTALPGAEHMPGAFEQAGDSPQRLEDVIAALGGDPEIEDLLTAHGWQAAMARTFTSNDPDSTGSTQIVVSVNAFEDKDSALAVFPKFDAVLQGFGWTSSEMEPVGEGSTMLTWTNSASGEEAVTIYVVSGQLLYRVFVIGPEGFDSRPNAMYVVNQVLGP